MIRLLILSTVALGALIRTQTSDLAASCGGWGLWGGFRGDVDYAVAQNDTLIEMSGAANRTHRNATNFRIAYTRIGRVA